MMNSEMSALYRSWKAAPKAIIGFSLLASLTISACASRNIPGSIDELSGPFGADVDATPDANGIITRGDVRYIVATPSDTLSAMAARAGVSPTALAEYNGLPLSYLPKAGEVLAVPKIIAPTIPVGFGTEVESSIETTNLGSGLSKPSTHTVIPGETIFEVARLYNVSVQELSNANNLGADLTINPGQVLQIPREQLASNTISTPSSTLTDATETSESSSTPTQTSSLGGSSSFSRPVSGTVIEEFDEAADKDGYVYSTSSQAPVQAASDGKVVLVSNSTGDQGTVVMIQHPNGLISIYGHMSNLKVSKGDSVSKGQNIGTTESGELMFQLRRGTSPVDPANYL